ncbi:flavodoxin family protein [Desulfoplanes formicivorans]|uniref:Flavodoxin n=1 Tax=Desulfoplanes formicivorans TaxID=1592317 RepID=A0A194AI67_9BACT|nr:flavodoxin family protein [Desulfoplanes formicivorans]GAU08766.1 flavodoxin [Desulfoplanes formicivorans]
MILGVEGSPRTKGNSEKMLAAILAGARQGGQTCVDVHLRDCRYEPCVGCERCRKDKICTRFQDAMTLIYLRLQKARGLVLVSPVNNYNITAWMKAFIDRLYCFYQFEDTRPRGWSSRLAGQGRKAVIAAIGEQEHPQDLGIALEAMRLPLEALGYEIVAEMPVLGLFDRGAIGGHQDILDRAHEAGGQLAKSL